MKHYSHHIPDSLTLVLSGSLLLAGGCLSVGPDYIPPETPAVMGWSTALNSGVTSGATDQKALSRWWTVFNDPALAALMECARTNNLDLRQAEGRLREARAQRGIARADRFPTLGASGSASQGQSSKESGTGTSSEHFSASLDASWELDFFGKKRRALESADATLQASQEDLHDTLVSLLAEVALDYVDIRSYQMRLTISETNLIAQSDTYNIARWRREAGLTTQLDEDQARLSLEQTRAEIPTLQTGLAKAKYQLSVLMGQPPGTQGEALANRKAIPVAPTELAIGVPADLLRRRPDVRRAERQLAVQTAQIGVAAAARYPSFSLAGSIGLESLAFHNLFTVGARTATAAADAAWTLIDGGRIEQGIAVQTAKQEQALNLYKATVLTAFLDVENALVANANERTRRRALEEAMKSGQSAFELARDQYSSGLANFQTVLDAQRSLLSVQTQCATSDAEVTSNMIRLYKALGGGWTALSPAVAQTNTTHSGGEIP